MPSSRTVRNWKSTVRFSSLEPKLQCNTDAALGNEMGMSCTGLQPNVGLSPPWYLDSAWNLWCNFFIFCTLSSHSRVPWMQKFSFFLLRIYVIKGYLSHAWSRSESAWHVLHAATNFAFVILPSHDWWIRLLYDIDEFCCALTGHLKDPTTNPVSTPSIANDRNQNRQLKPMTAFLPCICNLLKYSNNYIYIMI